MGTVFNIQKFSTHDGPGIRTVVFLKGCPMRCLWCSNPESQTMSASIFWDERKCIGCRMCQKACAHSILPGMQGVEKNCTLCGDCVRACPAQALEYMGEEKTAAMVMEAVNKDKAFYEESGGGVTISGGEPLLQPDFVLALAREMKKEGYHLALETTGDAEWDVAEKVFEMFDMILYDIKHMDPKQHKKYTGVSNERILANACRAREKGVPIIYRVPFIGGVNASLENMEKLGQFALETGVREIHLLPYHTYGENKYKLLRKQYNCRAYRPSEEEIKEIQTMLESKGIFVKVGG